MAVKFRKGIDLTGQRGVNASDPTTGSDLATKQYVDQVARGIADLKDPVRGASTGNLALTALVNGLVHDGITYATGDRMLLRHQTTASQNGIYTIAASGTASRATDADASDEVTRGMSTTVLEGTQKGTGATQANPVTYVLTTADPITLGTTALTFSPIGSTGGGSTYSPGAGLAESPAGTFNVGQGTGITVNADDVAINTSVVVRKYAADCAATTNPQTFTTGLGTDDITVDVWSGGEKVYPDITKASGTVTVDWGAAPTAGLYRVVAHG